MTSQPTERVAAIAIGGSAGAVEALLVLLPALQPDCGIPIFIVTHLPRERPSLLPTIFSGKCALRVMEAQDKQPIEAGSAYFAPPDYHLLVDLDEENTPTLALSADELVHFSRPSVDILFESAADLYGSALLGIVLSGANEDGAAGLAAIAAAGGTTLVQDPKGAVARAMPAAALRAAPRSTVLNVASMAQLLAQIRGGRLGAAGLGELKLS